MRIKIDAPREATPMLLWLWSQCLRLKGQDGKGELTPLEFKNALAKRIPDMTDVEVWELADCLLIVREFRTGMDLHLG